MSVGAFVQSLQSAPEKRSCLSLRPSLFKPFDRVWHDGLVSKLIVFGADKNSFGFASNFVNNGLKAITK